MHHVTGKSGNALGNDQIDLTGTTVSNHAIESVSMLERSPADALIRVDPDQSPTRMMGYEIFVILPLKLIRGRLADIIRRDTNIDGNPLRNVVIVIICLFLGWNVLVILIVKLNVIALADTISDLLLLSIIQRSSPPGNSSSPSGKEAQSGVGKNSGSFRSFM